MSFALNTSVLKYKSLYEYKKSNSIILFTDSCIYEELSHYWDMLNYSLSLWHIAYVAHFATKYTTFLQINTTLTW